MTDINNIKQTEEIALFKHSDRLLRASAEAVNALLAEADFQAGVSRTLKIIGEAVEVDRVYIFENHTDAKTGAPLASQRHEWAREGITPQIANPTLQNLEYLPVFKRWHEMLSVGEPIFGLIRDFPEPEKPLLESQDIISILTVPIKIRGNLWGFIGFDDCRRERSWTPAEISILTAISVNIGYIMFQKQTEKILKRFQAALDGTGDAIGMSDMQGHHFYQNTSFFNLLGYTAEELEKAGGPLVAFHNKSAGEELFKSIFAGKSWHGEVEMRSRSGRIIPTLVRGDAIKGEDGKPFAVFGIFSDITKRKEIETALQESETRYHELFNNINSGVAVYEVKDNGQDFIFKDLNRAGEEIDHDQRERLIGRSIFEVRPGIRKFGLIEVFQRVWQTGKPAFSPMALYKDSNLTGWYENFVYKLPSGEIVTVFNNVTERRQMERSLQESETRYRRLVEATIDYIYKVNIENGQAVSTIHGPNCLSVTGYSSEEYQTDQNLWLKMVHPDDRQTVVQQAQRILNGETTQPIEHRIYHKNGTICWVRNTPVPHFDASGKLISYDGLVCNITERKNAEEQLKEHTRRLEILNRIITAVNRVDNLGMLLNELLKSSVEIVSFDGGGIYLVNADNENAELVCHQGGPDDLLKKSRTLKRTAANCRMLFIEGKPIFTDDYSAISSEGDAKWNMRSVARIPLISKDKIIGALALVNTKGHIFNENEKELLLSIGRQIGTAIAKMHTETALRENEEKFRSIFESTKDCIMVWDRNYNYLYANQAAIDHIGTTRDKVIGKNIRDGMGHIPDFMRLWISRIDQVFINKNGMRVEDAVPVGGNIVHSESVLSPIRDADGIIYAVSVVYRDITDRKLAAAALVAANKQLSTTNEHLIRREQELMKANHEKEILLKEIHHRVKNNLQIISSLINLQIHKIADRQAVGLLKECQSRIKTIAMVHEKMYQLGDLARVDIGDYLENLTSHIGHMYLADPASVTIKVNAKDVYLPIDQAIPCALVVNELVSNSFKHAFPEHKAGEISIQMVADENGNYVLTVSDNGVGLPPGTDYRNTKSLGMQLVNTFVNQLHGTMELANNPQASPACPPVPERRPGSSAREATPGRAGTTFKISFAQSPTTRQKRAQGESNSSSQDENLVS